MYNVESPWFDGYAEYDFIFEMCERNNAALVSAKYVDAFNIHRRKKNGVAMKVRCGYAYARPSNSGLRIYSQNASRAHPLRKIDGKWVEIFPVPTLGELKIK